MLKYIWDFINYGSRWIAIINGTILFAVGVTLVALGDSAAYLLFSGLGLFALYVGVWRPDYWANDTDTESGKK